MTRWFQDRRILGPAMLELEAGVVCVVRGENGSGKTTLLRLAAGLLPPTSGQRWCPGTALYLRPGAGARSGQRVADAIAYAALLAGGSRATSDEALAACGLGELTGRRVETLSSGQRARMSLAVAVAARPALLCLDEPLTHLDEEGATRLGEALEVLTGRGTAVLWAALPADPVPALPHASLVLSGGALRAVA